MSYATWLGRMASAGRRASSDTVRSAVCRSVLLPIAAVAIYVSTRRAITAVGPEQYGIVSLLITLPYLLPVSDFGLGSAITTELGRSGWVPGRSDRTVLTVVRMLSLITAGIVVLAAGLSATGLLAPMIGVTTPRGNLLAALVLSTFALTIPLGVGGRILVGVGRQATATAIQTLTPVYALACLVLALFIVHADVFDVAVALSLGPLLSGVLQCLAARRAIRQLAPAASNVGVGATSIREIMAKALPLSLVTLVLPLAYQSDRVVIAHESSRTALAEYSVVGTLYGSLAGVIGAAGLTLWPYFAGIHARGQRIRSALRRRAEVVILIGVVAGLALAVFGHQVSELVSASQIDPPSALVNWFAGFLVVLAVQYPAAMLLLGFEDYWFGAGCGIAMVAANVPLSILLARPFDATGPVIASVVTTILFIDVPMWWRAEVLISRHECVSQLVHRTR